MLFSDSINWQGRRFFKITEFLKILNKQNEPNFKEEIDREEKFWITENISSNPKIELDEEQKDQVK